MASLLKGSVAAVVPGLSFSEVTLRFSPDVTALEDLSFVVDPGEVYCILGGPKSGKSVIVDLALGVRSPTSGTVAISGRDIRGMAPLEPRRLVGLVCPGTAVYASLTPLQNLRFLVRMSGSPVPTDVDARNALRAAGVPDRDFNARLSGLGREIGIAVNLATAVLLRRSVVVLDNPTRGLDSRAAAKLAGTLRFLGDSGVAVLVATDDVFMARAAADRVGLLKKGRKLAERTRSQLLDENTIDLFADYLGSSDLPASNKAGPAS
jgi:ABC-2 type transport system ATP-binding protein